MPPRVEPRTPIERRVDRTVHPPRAELREADETDVAVEPMHWTTRAALALLVVFLVAAPIGLALHFSIGAGLIGLSVTAIVVSLLLGLG